MKKTDREMIETFYSSIIFELSKNRHVTESDSFIRMTKQFDGSIKTTADIDLFSFLRIK
jgi:hypothetical protein